MPALVAQAEDSHKNSWVIHLQKNSDNSNMLYGDLVRSYDYKLDNRSANAEVTNNVKPRVVEYMISNIVQMAWKEPERLIF